jgi:PTS system galactitol-specific IIA component
MVLKDLISENLILLDMPESEYREALNSLAQPLLEAGFVKEGYLKALLEREEQYPTGLKLDGELNVSIPHADAEWAIKPVIAVGVARDTVRFRSMEEPDKTVDVKLIFVLAMPWPERQVALLRDLMTVVQDRANLCALASAKRPEDVVEVFRKNGQIEEANPSRR